MESLDQAGADQKQDGAQASDARSHGEAMNGFDPLGHLKLEDAELLSEDMLGQLKSDVGEATARKLLAGFFDELNGKVSDLRDALDDSDMARLRHICHSIKGSAATYGALRLSLSAMAAEQAADAEQLDAARAAARSTLDLVPDTQQAFAAEF
jgi:HPt (histidine-containing phosphotransfer) domain-containing protein